MSRREVPVDPHVPRLEWKKSTADADEIKTTIPSTNLSVFIFPPSMTLVVLRLAGQRLEKLTRRLKS
jgi:hypothetical protein